VASVGAACEPTGSDGPRRTNADFPLLKVLLSCHLDVDSRSSVALPTAASGMEATIHEIDAMQSSGPQLATRTSALFGITDWPLYLPKRKIGSRHLRANIGKLLALHDGSK
jgi:hypothetical protein